MRAPLGGESHYYLIAKGHQQTAAINSSSMEVAELVLDTNTEGRACRAVLWARGRLNSTMKVWASQYSRTFT